MAKIITTEINTTGARGEALRKIVNMSNRELNRIVEQDFNATDSKGIKLVKIEDSAEAITGVYDTIFMCPEMGRLSSIFVEIRYELDVDNKNIIDVVSDFGMRSSGTFDKIPAGYNQK